MASGSEDHLRPRDAPDTARARIRALTLNLWGRDGAWEQRRDVLVQGLRELGPDLIAFQESIVTDEYDQIADLIASEFNVVHQRTRHPNGMGVSIASRWPIRQHRELDLHLTPRTDDFPCVTLAAEIETPEPIGPLLFVNHFPSYQLDFEAEREVQAVAAARFIEEMVGNASPHVILAGDLDADPDASSIRFWCGRHALDGMSVCYRDVWESDAATGEGETFTPANPLMAAHTREWPFRRIDYIFVRCAPRGPTLEVVECRRAFDEPIDGVWASDHFGVTADLAVAGNWPMAADRS